MELKEFEKRFKELPKSYTRIILSADRTHIYANEYIISKPYSKLDKPESNELEIYFYINYWYETSLGNREVVRVHSGDAYLNSIIAVL